MDSSAPGPAPRATPWPAGPDLSEADVDDLLQHSAWLRRLAARLARDEGEADDLVQRTWLAALRRRGPRSGGQAARGWLSRVLQNEARQHRRSEGRRRDHESRAVSADAAPSPSAHSLIADAESRLALQRELLAAVDALGEPARSAVLERYIEGRPVPEIAERAGVPPRTVETRLRRARQALRERLDTRHGSRGAWLAAALPVDFARPDSVVAASSSAAEPSAAAPATSAAASSLLLIVMNLKFAALGAAVAAAGAFILWQLGEDSGPAGRSDIEGRARDATVEPVSSAAPEAAEGAKRREEVALAAADPETDAAAAAAPIPSVTGKVFDERGQPLPHFEVVFDPPLGGTTEARSDRDGIVPVPDARGVASMRARSDTFTVLFSRKIGGYLRKQGLGPILAVAPGYRLDGRITDPSGLPIEGAEWTLELPEGHRTRYADPLELVDLSEWSGASDESGVVRFEGIPALAECRLTVSAGGYVSVERSDLPLPGEPGAALPIEIVLEPVDPELVVRGVVREPGGDVVDGAHVALGVEAMETAADGAFSFTLEGDPQRRRGPQRLLAAAAGWRPVTFEPAPVPANSSASSEGGTRGGWPDWVELRFEERPLEITGVVLGPDGEPHPGARVWVTDPTALGGLEDMTLAESIGTIGMFWRTFEADENGGFRVPQLADRDYGLRAIDANTLHVSDVTVTLAGEEDAVLQLARNVEVVELEVLVEDARGRPIEGAKVRPERFVMHASVKGSSGARTEHARRDGGLTSSDGVCSIGQVALQEGLELFVYGPDLMSRRVDVMDLPVVDGSTEHRVRCVVHSECEVRVLDDSPEGERATAFALLDASGEPLWLTFTRANGIGRMRTGWLEDGRSRAFLVSGEAVTLELRRVGELIESRPIALDPDGLNELRR